MHKSVKILWVRPILVDRLLDKAAEFEMFTYLAERDYCIWLLAGLSREKLKIIESLEKHANIHFILIPLQYVPIVTPVLVGFATLMLLPFLICTKRPKFIITHPDDLSFLIFIYKPLFFLLKIRVLLDIRSTPVWHDLRAQGFRGSLTEHTFNFAVLVAKLLFDGMTIITHQMKEQICEMYDINPSFIDVWTMGVSTKLFKPNKYDGMNIKKKLGLADRFVVFYHGVFSPHRGLIESIKSIKILQSKHKCNRVVLFLLGNGQALPTLRELVEKDGLEGRLIIHDAVDYIDVPKYIAMSDIGIVPLPDLPDWRYQCPQKLLEYLAMKKVVIVTDIPANREVVGGSKCGIYISSADPKGIANAIEYAYDNREKLRGWGSYGRIIIEEKYSWEKVAKNLESFLLECASR